MFSSSDSKNGVYFAKRLAYIKELAKVLQDKKLSDIIETVSLTAFNGDKLKPILFVTLKQGLITFILF